MSISKETEEKSCFMCNRQDGTVADITLRTKDKGDDITALCRDCRKRLLTMLSIELEDKE